MTRIMFVPVTVLLALGAASCASEQRGSSYGMSGYGMSTGMSTSVYSAAPKAPPMAPSRKIDEADCTKPLPADGGNLLCK